MKIRELLDRIPYTMISGSDDLEITGISRDNRRAVPGDLFICTTGARFDTHSPEVIEKLAGDGVRAFVTDKETVVPEGSAVIRVENTREAGAFIYAAWYRHPADQLLMIGITGSKGKTTTTHMLAEILRTGGHKVGTIGTNGAIIDGKVYELSNTTPESNEVQMYLRQMVNAGCDAAVLEVSSQGMKQHRVDGFTFDYGILMNIQEGDHIGPNEHETFDDYMYCKAQVLNHSKCALIHGDDPYYERVMQYVKVPAERFGADPSFDFHAEQIEKTFDEEEELPGIAFHVGGKITDSFWINLPGAYNVWNAVAAIAVAAHEQIPHCAMKQALSHIHIKGRADIVYRGKFSVCVDFAHNGASTWNHLQALREYRPKRLVCIFGADGNRSKGRRYGMGEAAGTLADFSIVTSGHNRWETFEQILADTEVGLHKAPNPNYIAIKNRKEAIRYAIENAEEGDLITIIGLGHESWQEEMGVKYPYSDTEYVLELVKELGL